MPIAHRKSTRGRPLALPPLLVIEFWTPFFHFFSHFPHSPKVVKFFSIFPHLKFSNTSMD